MGNRGHSVGYFDDKDRRRVRRDYRSKYGDRRRVNKNTKEDDEFYFQDDE